ncbi:hypothetical protein N7519_003345 [Penicillium mononematosum]|uniref:uncharacterized protein n=1 Tax=Penicillium mononematosum TaxID=268346 RepID=UPI0025499476|nr:uncharacterized protein N7519_003345 [Penicillium mononematosum]KAJ6188437.1 hypothetical protein N7519_003345 [Penicillium mononematosum]
MRQTDFGPSRISNRRHHWGRWGIGAAAAKVFNEHGANVVLADIPAVKDQAQNVVASLPHPHKAAYIPVDILNWKQMNDLFQRTVEVFGDIHIVVANAAIMESTETLSMENMDNEGNLRESEEAFRVIDVNLKGTLNTLRLGMHYVKSSSKNDTKQLPAIILVASTSGYFGDTGVAAYVASKHGVIGLLRASQTAAQKYGIVIKGIAPFFTPTQITTGLTEQWKAAGLETNTPEMVARAIVQSSIDDTKSGACTLISGKFQQELEFTRNSGMPQWLGEDLSQFMKRAFTFLKDMGGLALPKGLPGRNA